jgi:hypothetical protein
MECGALIQDGGQRLVLEHVVTHQQAQQGFGQLPPAVVPHLPNNTRTKLINYGNCLVTVLDQGIFKGAVQ